MDPSEDRWLDQAEDEHLAIEAERMNAMTKTQSPTVSTRLVSAPAPAPAADPFGPLLDPQKYDLLARASKAFSESTLVPAHFRGKPADVFVVLQMAWRLNLDPFTALQSVFVVSGRPGMSATLVISLANRSGIFAGPITFRTEGEGDEMRVTASGTIRATGETVSATVGMETAKAEGWVRNLKYRTMAEHMLTFRSATWLVRRYCPEVLMGMQTAEELQDVVAARPAPV